MRNVFGVRNSDHVGGKLHPDNRQIRDGLTRRVLDVVGNLASGNDSRDWLMTKGQGGERLPSELNVGTSTLGELNPWVGTVMARCACQLP